MVVAVRFMSRSSGPGEGGPGGRNLFDWGRRPPTATRHHHDKKDKKGKKKDDGKVVPLPPIDGAEPNNEEIKR